MTSGRRLRWTWGALVCGAVVAAACGAPEQEQADPGAAEAPPERQTRAQMMGDQRLEQHMQHMAAVPPDSLASMMPMHLEEVGAILDEMEPMTMGMQSDTVWRSTVDSVQNDLARMRDMGAEELSAFMPEHMRRMQRLVFLHDSAMGSER